jgi:hypothetical protein
MSPVKVAAPLRQLHPDAATVFKDSYLVEFLDLPPGHSEADLQRGLVEQLKKFLIELGSCKGTHVPIVKSFCLSTRNRENVWIEPKVNRETNSYTFCVIEGGPNSPPSG